MTSRSSSAISSSTEEGTGATPLGLFETGEELLELGADLLTAGQRLVVGQQVGGLGVEGVVLLLEAGDHVAHVVGVGDLGGDLDLAGLAGLLERRLVPLQPGDVLEPLEQRGRGLRVVELRDVVRDVRDEAHGVVTPLPQPELDAATAALAGTRISPRQTFSCTSSRCAVAWLVSCTGRVCGTAIGTEPSETTRRTSKCSTTARTALANASQRMSGSGPVSRRYGEPSRSSISRTTSRGAS